MHSRLADDGEREENRLNLHWGAVFVDGRGGIPKILVNLGDLKRDLEG
jgi:hypothetical protein